MERIATLLLIPVVIYFAICLATPFDIGYRHLLPILPCLFIFTSQLALIDWKTSRPGSVAVSAMVIWLTITSVVTFPHYLTFLTKSRVGRITAIRFWWTRTSTGDRN